MKTSRWSRFALVLALVPILAVALVPSLGSADAPIGQYTATTTPDATVTDNKTLLVWQRVDDGNTYTWANAKTHCTGLNAMSFGGFSTGWRLPTIKELQTIVDDEVATGPTIDPVFTGTVADFYWSTTPGASAPSVAWSVNFGDGYTGDNVLATTYRVRCVR